jgi:hypothetical protein
VSLSHEAVKGSVDGGGERGESASAGGTGAEVAGGRRQRVGGGATMGAGEAEGWVAAQRWGREKRDRAARVGTFGELFGSYEVWAL